MRRIRQLVILSGVMIAVLIEIRPALAQSATFRMPGCRTFENPANILRYDFSGGVRSGIVEALMSVGATLGARLRVLSIKAFEWLSDMSTASPFG
jgi:hypothetical protein